MKERNETNNETNNEKKIRMLLESLMGKALDNARMSDMGLRQFEQFERTTKGDFNNVIQFFKENFTLKEEK